MEFPQARQAAHRLPMRHSATAAGEQPALLMGGARAEVRAEVMAVLLVVLAAELQVWLISEVKVAEVEP